MAYERNLTIPSSLLEELQSEGLAALPELIRVVLNAAMVAERQAHLGLEPYERSPQRRTQANGFKPKTVQTRLGPITLQVPQVRDASFYPAVLERGLRSERALHLALAEMYVQGVSTRKVNAILERMCGTSVSSTQVSRCAAELDEALAAWRARPLGRTPDLYLDARYEKVRHGGQVRDAAVLWACGVDAAGYRRVLGVSVSLSEHEVHWRTFLASLVERGLTGVELVIADNHQGLAAARRAVLGSVPYQRCQVHLQRNATAYVPRRRMRGAVAADLRAIFNAPNRVEADRLLAQAVERYQDEAPQLSTWLEENVPEGLSIFAFPSAHRRRLRTTNGLERVNQELRRRTRVVRIFPNEASCLRLVSALLMEQDEEWMTGRIYLSPTSS